MELGCEPCPPSIVECCTSWLSPPSSELGYPEVGNDVIIAKHPEALPCYLIATKGICAALTILQGMLVVRL